PAEALLEEKRFSYAGGGTAEAGNGNLVKVESRLGVGWVATVMGYDAYGNIITVTVFNDRGYPVRMLAERHVAGAGAQFIWDGTSDSGARLPAGLYMIMAESFNAAGSSRRWKEVCALLYR
ncbi:MAG: hypothetical protein ABR560_01180, partial [Bacteroidales bacterium]